jgi:transcription initiation factor TFIIE subunit beta
VFFFFQALKSSGDIYLLPGEQDMVFPNDPRSRLELDTELKKLFYEIKLPKDMLDIEKDLRRNGEKPMTDTAKRRAAAEIFGKPSKPKKSKKKQRGMTSRTRITNIHLPGLFELPMDTKDFI